MEGLSENMLHVVIGSTTISSHAYKRSSVWMALQVTRQSVNGKEELLYHLNGSRTGEASDSLLAGVQEAMAEMECESDKEIDEQAGGDDEAEGDIGGLIDYVSALSVSDKLP